MRSYFEYSDDIPTGDRHIVIHLDKSEMVRAQLDKFDLMLFDDIQNGEPSDTPMADQLLGLETLVRKMEIANKKLLTNLPSKSTMKSNQGSNHPGKE